MFFIWHYCRFWFKDTTLKHNHDLEIYYFGPCLISFYFSFTVPMRLLTKCTLAMFSKKKLLHHYTILRIQESLQPKEKNNEPFFWDCNIYSMSTVLAKIFDSKLFFFARGESLLESWCAAFLYNWQRPFNIFSICIKIASHFIRAHGQEVWG